MLKFKKNTGYTLIEIIVVIAILGFVITSAMYAINISRMKSRDAKRMADLDAIRKAIELYYDDNDNIYPGIGDGGNDWYYNDACDGLPYAGPMSTFLSPDYISNVPDDPINNIEDNGGCYWYLRKNSGKGYVILMTPENKDLIDEHNCPDGGSIYYCIGENW